MYIIKNGQVHIGNGEILSNTDILIENGKISEIGKDLKKDGAEIVDATGKDVFPGFIDTLSSIGCMGIPTSYRDNCEISSPLMPEMDISYSIDPDEVNNQEFYRTGVTSIGASPDDVALIGGKIAVFKTGNAKFADRLVKKNTAMKCSFTTTPKGYYGGKNMQPMTKMGMADLLMSNFERVKKAEEKDLCTKDKELKKLLDGEINPIIAANSKAEIDAVMEIYGNECKQITLSDPFEFYRCMDRIIEKKVSVVMGNFCALSRKSRHDIKLEKLNDLIENGNLISLSSTCSGASEGREVLLWSAIDIYRAGVPAEEVIKMLTINAAKILGVDDRIGSIEKGKDADIIIYTAHPIKTYNAHVEKVFINGEVIL